MSNLMHFQGELVIFFSKKIQSKVKVLTLTPISTPMASSLLLRCSEFVKFEIRSQLSLTSSGVTVSSSELLQT